MLVAWTSTSRTTWSWSAGETAGLSAALVLGRSRRSVLVIDAGEPRNAPAEHGGEVSDQPLGIVASGPDHVERALLFRQWSDDVVILLNGQPAPQGEDAEKLAARDYDLILEETAAAVAEHRKEVA